MRVAVVTTSWPRFAGDPSGHFVAGEVALLTRRGDDVVVVAAEGDAFGWPGFAARVRESPLRVVTAAAWVARARRTVAEGQFDRVVAHSAVPCAWPVAMGASGRLEVVSHGGDVRLLRRLPGPARAHVAGAIAARADLWRFVSESLLESLLAVLPREAAARVRAIAEVAPCALEMERPSESAVAEKRARIGSPFAVCVARLVPSKRVEAAIAWARAERVPLVVVGDGPEMSALEGHARASRATAAVHFVGRTTRDEVLAWIAASDVLLQPSRVEGLSTVVREAELLGVPVRTI